MIDEKILKRWEAILAEAERLRDERIGLQRQQIIDTDPNAPLCINCRYCQQEGFLFHCPIFELPEDGKVVGMDGNVYYRRKGHKSKTYRNVPMKSGDCEVFEPLLL